MRLLLGIDDTDNSESRGTGYNARQIGKIILKEGYGTVNGISRHQLLFDPQIPYTSKNSSACLDVETNEIDKLTDLVADYLIRESAPGSDSGLSIIEFNRVDKEIIEWGQRAKKEILNMDEALSIAGNKNFYLKGFTGEKIGVIGALAAVGLRKSGDDGRFIWLKGKEIRELEGSYFTDDLLSILNVDEISDLQGNRLDAKYKINVGKWVRPVLKNNKIIIFVEQYKTDSGYEWKVAAKDFIKKISD